MLCFSSGKSNSDDERPARAASKHPPRASASAAPASHYARRAAACELKDSHRASNSITALARGMSLTRKGNPGARKRKDSSGSKLMVIGSPTGFVHHAHEGLDTLMHQVPSTSTVSSIARSPFDPSRQSLQLSTAPTSPQSSPPAPATAITNPDTLAQHPHRLRTDITPTLIPPPRRGSLARASPTSPLARAPLSPIRSNSLATSMANTQRAPAHKPAVLTKARPVRPVSFSSSTTHTGGLDRPQTAQACLSASQSDVGLSPTRDASLRSARRASMQAIKRKPAPAVTPSVIKQAGIDVVVTSGGCVPPLPSLGDKKAEVGDEQPSTTAAGAVPLARDEMNRLLAADPTRGVVIEPRRMSALLQESAFRRQLLEEYDVVPASRTLRAETAGLGR